MHVVTTSSLQPVCLSVLLSLSLSLCPSVVSCDNDKSEFYENSRTYNHANNAAQYSATVTLTFLTLKDLWRNSNVVIQAWAENTWSGLNRSLSCYNLETRAERYGRTYCEWSIEISMDPVELCYFQRL